MIPNPFDYREAGMSMAVTPNGDRASMMAFMTAGVLPMVPASPMPLTPSGLVGLGVIVLPMVSDGMSAADGTR